MSASNGSSTKRKKGDVVDGILLLNKPTDASSNQALQRVKRLLNAQKAGHTGSLDPIATGVLPLCFGHATKVAGMMLGLDKRYRVTIQLGALTTTGDREGEVLETQQVNASKQTIYSTVAGFIGELDQVPPMYSALKHNGQPLYKLARQGIEIERKPRRVSAHDIQILDLAEDRLTLDVHCSSGFYIRSLAEDIGSQLGCGGYVQTLHRSAVANIPDTQCLTMAQLEELTPTERVATLMSADSVLTDLPMVTISNTQRDELSLGRVVAAIAPAAEEFRVYDEQGFYGIGEASSDAGIKLKRLMSTRD